MESSTASGEGIDRLVDLIRTSRRTIALTGAGISVPSGIPDFRSPEGGIWHDVDPMEVAHISVLRSDPARFWSFYGARFAALGDKKPNPAHAALVKLERAGLLQAVVTQNIDLLHTKAGTAELVEVHGSIQTSRCMACGVPHDLEVVVELLNEAPVPSCTVCGGILKPDVVLFGEALPADAVERAFTLAREADLILCVGSSLEVHPVAMLPGVTKNAGGRLAVLTKGSTPYDAEADVRLQGDVADDLAEVVGRLAG